MCGGQTSPHKPRLVVSHSTCPPLSSHTRYCIVLRLSTGHSDIWSWVIISHHNNTIQYFGKLCWLRQTMMVKSKCFPLAGQNSSSTVGTWVCYDPSTTQEVNSVFPGIDSVMSLVDTPCKPPTTSSTTPDPTTTTTTPITTTIR